MSALPAEGVVRASVRWWQLLGRSSLAQAWAIIRANAAYKDLTPTQYSTALDWLRATGCLVMDPGSGLTLNPHLRGLPHKQFMRILFQRALEEARPAWLPDADVLVLDSSELPQDALALAENLDVVAADAFLAVSRAQRRVDLERRALIGATGERLFVQRLESSWLGQVSHVSREDDGLGFDVVLTSGAGEWHLEVKSTTRRGRLVVYLSRNEYEVSQVDLDWRLVIVGLGEDGDLKAVATVQPEVVSARVPDDRHWAGRWESMRLELTPDDLDAGLSFLMGGASIPDPVLSGVPLQTADRFGWLPSPRT